MFVQTAGQMFFFGLVVCIKNNSIFFSKLTLIFIFFGFTICLLIVEFQKLWRSVPVDSIDEEKIDEYLKKQGISSMQETGPKKVVSVRWSTCLISSQTPHLLNLL